MSKCEIRIGAERDHGGEKYYMLERLLEVTEEAQFRVTRSIAQKNI